MTARSSPSDAALITAARTDPEAFTAVFERHAGSVHGFLARRAGQHVADDLLGEVFATAFGARGRYDTAVEDARPWLFGIARNVLHSHQRSGRRLADAVARLPVEGPTDTWPDVDARLDAASQAHPVRRALLSLPDAEREVLQLVAWEDLTPTEAGAVLGIPAGTARSRLHRARTAVRAALGGQAPPTGTHGPELRALVPLPVGVPRTSGKDS